MAPKNGQKALGRNETINWGRLTLRQVSRWILQPGMSHCVLSLLNSVMTMYPEGLSNFIPLSRMDEENRREIQKAQCKLNKTHINFITPSLGCLGSMLLSDPSFSCVNLHSILLRASLWIGQKSMLYAFIYLYYISDITSDIIVQTHHQVNTFRDLGFICLGKWRRKRTADQKWRKCGSLKTPIDGFVRDEGLKN